MEHVMCEMCIGRSKIVSKDVLAAPYVIVVKDNIAYAVFPDNEALWEWEQEQAWIFDGFEVVSFLGNWKNAYKLRAIQ